MNIIYVTKSGAKTCLLIELNIKLILFKDILTLVPCSTGVLLQGKGALLLLNYCC